MKANIEKLKQLAKDLRHEEQREECGDGPRGGSDDGAETQAEETKRRQIETTADEGTHDPGITDGRTQAVPGEQCLEHEVRGEARGDEFGGVGRAVRCSPRPGPPQCRFSRIEALRQSPMR